MDPIEQVRAFAEATDLEGKWSSARQMMSSKAKPNGEQFYSLLQQAFEGLGHIAASGDDSSKLVAIDLLVRLFDGGDRSVLAQAQQTPRIATESSGRVLRPGWLRRLRCSRLWPTISGALSGKALEGEVYRDGEKLADGSLVQVLKSCTMYAGDPCQTKRPRPRIRCQAYFQKHME